MASRAAIRCASSRFGSSLQQRIEFLLDIAIEALHRQPAPWPAARRCPSRRSPAPRWNSCTASPYWPADAYMRPQRTRASVDLSSAATAARNRSLALRRSPSAKAASALDQRIGRIQQRRVAGARRIHAAVMLRLVAAAQFRRRGASRSRCPPPRDASGSTSSSAQRGELQALTLHHRLPPSFTPSWASRASMRWPSRAMSSSTGSSWL